MEATKTLGKYTLVRHLATGGMAEIWLAEQAGPGGFAKELVIKQILPHLAQDDQFTRMFLDEARLAAQLSHPKIAQIYELGETDGQYFIAMEFIDGVDLSDVIELAAAKGRPIPFNIVAKIMMDVLEALDYAHDYTGRDGQAFNLVHRDVTPHNVIVSNDGIVKLVDFGVAKARANQSKTQTGAVKGKFAYMAPEQIQNKDLDRRADIFAAGVLLYELLTSEKPFGEDLAAVSNILSQDAPDPRQARPDVPEELVRVAHRAMTKERDGRYFDAHDMLRDIESWLRNDGEYVGDRQLSAWIREMQGMPTIRNTGAISPNRSTPHEAKVPDATPTPGPVNTPMPSPATPTAGLELPPALTGDHETVDEDRPRPADLAPSHTAEVNSVGQGGARTDTAATEAAGGANTGLIVLFLVLVLAIIGVGGAVVYFVVIEPAGENGASEPVTKTEQPKDSESPVIPNELKHLDGNLVTLSARKQVKVYFDGQLIGKTPLRLNLRPGEYEVEIEGDDGKVEHKFTVDDKALQTVQLKH